MKNLAKNWKTLFTVCLILGLVTACGESKKGFEYKKYLLDVNCGEKFKGKLYRMGHTEAALFFIWYQDMEGRKVDLPDEGCVKITLKELPSPTEEGN
jgi:hypothetical protein